MNRQQKEKVVEGLRENLLKSQATFIVDYKGLNVAQMQTLRFELRQKGGALKVAKARLMKLAVESEPGVSDITPYLKEQIGLVFSADQFSDVAKILTDFSKENKALDLVAGLLESQFIGKERISQIASLPPKEVLLAQVCGTLNAPIAGLVRSLNMIVLKLLFALKQIELQGKK